MACDFILTISPFVSIRFVNMFYHPEGLTSIFMEKNGTFRGEICGQSPRNLAFFSARF